MSSYSIIFIHISGRVIITINGLLYDLCDWKIEGFSTVANCLLNVCRLY